MSIQVTLLALAAECFALVFASKRKIFLFWVLNFFRRFVGRSVSSIGQCALVGLSDDVGLVKKSWEIRFQGKPKVSLLLVADCDANLLFSLRPAPHLPAAVRIGGSLGLWLEQGRKKSFLLLPLIQQGNILETTIQSSPQQACTSYNQENNSCCLT